MIQYHSRALTVLSSLTDEDRRRVIDAAAALEKEPREDWPKDRVVRIDDLKDFYLIRVDPSLRALVRAENGQRIELVDVVRKEAFQLFREQPQAAGVPQ